jgi:uncharacterized membrane protein
MANNVVIAVHASGATIALVLGGYNVMRRTKGDRRHRWIGRVWVIAMYWTVLSSFAIRRLRPGHFSWIHGLSLFTFVTLSIGLWAARSHRVRLHRQFITGSYLGLVGAFIGAVAVPSRDIPQWIVHEPLKLAIGAVISVGLAVIFIAAGFIAAGGSVIKRDAEPSVQVLPGEAGRVAGPAVGGRHGGQGRSEDLRVSR